MAITKPDTLLGSVVMDADGAKLGNVEDLYFDNDTDKPEWAAVKSGTVTAAGDDAMTRSEEQVSIGTHSQEVGRARLRKCVVTEQVTETVPVSHEEVRIEREAITDANREQATAGVEMSEAHYEIILHAETPVVEKEVVAVERVRLAKEAVTGKETVRTDVRREQIVGEIDPALRKP